MKDRLALVTGASRGFGRAIALELARRGAHLILVARTSGALEELDDEVRALGADATLVPLDLKDSEGIDRLGGAIFERWGRLDALVANAGILGVLSPLGHVRPKVWDDVMAVNVTANWRLIRSLDPLLRASDAGRAVFVSSGAAARIRAYWGPYAVSKVALEALAKTYAEEVAATAVRVSIFDPGAMRTRMREAAMPAENPEDNPLPEAVAPKLVDLLEPGYSVNGARVSYRG